MSTVVLDGGPWWLFLLVRLVELFIVVFLTVGWCMSMDRGLYACDSSSQKMAPGQPWMIFIPFFGFIWQFVCVNKVSLSLATEYHLRGWKSDEGKPGSESGLIACVAILIVFLVRMLWRDMNPGLAFFTSLIICICMYLHRERLNAFSERLEAEKQKWQQQFLANAGPNPFVQMFNQQPIYNQQPFQPQPYGQQQNKNPFEQQFNHQQQYKAPTDFIPNPHLTPHQQHQQYVQHQAQVHNLHEQQKRAQMEREKESMRPPGGWDGITTWEPPADWKQPDLSDPRAYF